MCFKAADEIEKLIQELTRRLMMGPTGRLSSASFPSLHLQCSLYMLQHEHINDNNDAINKIDAQDLIS